MNINFQNMKNLTITVLALLSVILVPLESYGWGRTGHDVVAAIAERHLTDRAKKKIESILGGKSIIYYTKWMDEVRHTPEYGYTTNWHVSHVDEDFRPVIAEKHGKYNGDALWGLRKVMPVLENYREYDDSTVLVNLKFLLHLIGDMHCPVHIYYQDYNTFYVTIDGERVSYHKLWDGSLLDSVHGWSYSEYADMLDRCSAAQIKDFCKGTFDEWVEDSARRCRVIYSWAGPETKIDQDFKNEAIQLAETQLVMAGYRLAHVLNSLFD